MGMSTLPKVIEGESDLERVMLVPKFEEPTDFSDFSNDVGFLVGRFELEDHYKGPGHSSDGITRGHEYWAEFDSKLSAIIFHMRVNRDTLMYTARMPDEEGRG